MSRKETKAGVSLITVLLFMLVATIAATATYKWITSEGRSSASRMLEQEAYQSSVAGLDNARTWMTYHANDVGNLIRQFIEGGNKPINITDRLRPLVRTGQNYQVWLTGVNTDKPTYKLKLVSYGESRNGTRHGEAAIYNVDGLYQVKVPKKTVEEASSIHFEFNYFGGSMKSAGHVGAKSLLVNGDIDGANPIYAETDIIVTGSVIMSGNSIGAEDNVCIGKNLDASNGVFGGNFYVGGDATNFVTDSKSEAKKDFYDVVLGETITDGPFPLTGNIYIEGNLEGKSGRKQEFQQNLSINGIWKVNLSEGAASVGGNLCVGETGAINVPFSANNTFSVGGNVWMPGNLNLWSGEYQEYGCTCTRVTSYNSYLTNYTWMVFSSTPNVSCGTDSEEWTAGSGMKIEYRNRTCAGSRLVASGDNFSTYDNIVLGSKTTSEVYIKSAYSSSNYKTKLHEAKHFPQTKDYPRQCLDNACNTQFWDGLPYHPYENKAPSDDKYYIYYMPDGVTDVDFRTYTDTYWHKTLVNYWIDFSAGDGGMKARFTTGDHSMDADHPVFASDAKTDLNITGGATKKYYRYLNHDGSKITGSPYCKIKAQKTWQPECGVTPWFKSSGTLHNKDNWGDKDFQCAESVKTYCMGELGTKNAGAGCDGADYKVPDLLKTGKSAFASYANKGCNVTEWKDDNFSAALNACYEYNTITHPEYAKVNLYNGYQVVSVTDDGKLHSSKTPLVGKFIIIVTNQMQQQNLPPTAPGSFVFLLLEQGAAKTIQPASNDGSDYSYFIYAEADIKEILFNNEVFKGSVYGQVAPSAADDDGCVKSDIQGRYMEYNDALIKSLEKANILCDRSVSVCGGIVPDDESGESGGGSGGGGTATYSLSSLAPENYFISMSPQLGVTLETQTKTMETIAEGEANETELEKAFMILPRIIYLPSDPFGKLSDYYNILPLNGSSLKKSDISIATASDSPTDCNQLTHEPLVSSGNFTEGTMYKCLAKANGRTEEDVPFWVVIGKDQRGTPFVNLVEASQQLPSTTTTPAEVHAHIPPHANDITLNVICPNIGGADGTEGNGWKYTVKSGGEKSGTTCTFEIGQNTTGPVDLLLFEVTTTDASNGTLSFQLGSGTGYLPSSPYTASLHVASTATLSRDEVTSADLDEFCANDNTACPENYRTYWPSCNISSGTIWVEPNVSSVPTTPNDQWSVSLGGITSVKLVSVANASVTSNCVVIIPDESRTVTSELAGGSITPNLRASIKAKKKTFRVGFIGKVGSGNRPTIKVHNDTRNKDFEPDCVYSPSEDNPQYCSYDLFAGEEVSFQLVDDNDDENFNYWKCEGGNCPTGTEPLASHEFPSITVSGDYTYLAHFGESDNHCFFDEFKEGTIGSDVYNRTNRNDLFACAEGVEYCIDYCNDENNGCTSLTENQNRKWRLINSSKRNLEYSSLYGHLSVKSSLNKGKKDSERKGVVVMSTVNAGMDGSMKALVQVPRSSEYGNSTKYIRNSGIILRSNADVTEFLMLNLYVNSSGYLEAQVCQSATTGCVSKSFSKTATVSSMVMLEAELKGNNLDVTVFTSPYYGTPTGETKSFDVSAICVKDRAHEYVGFSLADQNFKIHGIGWHSDDYNADCFDTYPTVKCSFAAKAEGGYIETDKDVVPWIGYSGWFSSTSCTPKYYYYGTDACYGRSGEIVECTSGKYNFASGTGNEGPHGYREGSDDVKTAKAWLHCSATSSVEKEWWENATENEYAHCGYFWTGAYVPCANDAELMSGETIYAGGIGESEIFNDQPKNLRKAKLVVTVVGDPSPNLELWLESKNSGDNCWGGCDAFQSQPVVITGASRTINKVEEVFIGDSSGFNPEEVTAVRVKNNGANEVTVTVRTECENSIKIEGCSVTYDESLSQWQLTVTVGGNGQNPRSNVTTTQIEARKNSADGESIVVYGNSNVHCANSGSGNDILCTYDENAYATNPGVTYVFNAKIVGNGGASTDIMEDCASKDIGQAEVSCAISSEEYVYGSALLPKFTPTITCPKTNGCGFDILYRGESIFDSPKKTPVDAAGYRATKTDETIEGEYTYTLHSTDGSFEDCSKKFKVVAPGAIKADCAFDPAVVAIGGKTKLVMSNIQNLTTTTEFKLSENGANVTQNINAGQSGEIALASVPSAPDHYTYKVSYVNAQNQNKDVCNNDPVLTVVDGLACSLKDHTITLNGSTTFEAVGGGSCEGSSLDGSPDGAGTPTKVNCKQYTISPTAPGTYTYTYTYRGNLGTNLHCPSTSNLTLTVEPPAPTFDCSADPVTIGSGNPSINLTNIQWCDDNCTVVLKKGNSTLPESGSGSTSGNNNYTINFTDNVTEAGPVDYTVTLSWANDKTLTKTCSVVYNAAPVLTCSDITWTPNSGQTPDNTGGGSWTGKGATNECFNIITTGYICLGSFQLTMADCKGETIHWNNATLTTLSDNNQTTGTIPDPANPTRISASKECTISDLYFTGCTQINAATNAPTITGCPTNTITKRPNNGFSFPGTVANCAVVGGCSYTLTVDNDEGDATTYYGGSIRISGLSSGTHDYTLSIWNSVNPSSPTTCSFKAKYEEVTMITLENDDTESIKCGDSFKTNISCTNNCSKLSCSGGFNFTVERSDGSSISGNQYYTPPFVVNGNGGNTTLIDEFTTDCGANTGNITCTAGCGC